MTKRTRSEAIHIRIDPSLCARLDELVRRKSASRQQRVSRSSIGREAIRFYLDNQEDILGSRRNFNREFRTGMRLLRWMLLCLVVLVAEVGSILILNLVYDLDEVERSQGADKRAQIARAFNGPNLVRVAMGKVSEQGPGLHDKFVKLALGAEMAELAE